MGTRLQKPVFAGKAAFTSQVKCRGQRLLSLTRPQQITSLIHSLDFKVVGPTMTI